MAESLYGVLFSNGMVKVGRTTNPGRRIKQHAERLAILDIRVTESHSAACAGPGTDAERALIRRCDEVGRRPKKTEWFTGLKFGVVRQWVNECAALVDAPHEGGEFGRRFFAMTLAERNAMASEADTTAHFLNNVAYGYRGIGYGLAATLSAVMRIDLDAMPLNAQARKQREIILRVTGAELRHNLIAER
jgi:hypothetical protein